MTSPGKCIILNVDDNEAARYIRGRILKAAGFEIREAASGREALDMLAHCQPDLVLLDVKLPDLSGFEVCRRIKADAATASIPVLHVSACLVSGTDRVEGLEAGADGYLTEPVQPEVLVATVKALLRIARAEELSSALSRVNAAIGSTLDFDEIMRRVIAESLAAIGAEAATIAMRESGLWVAKYNEGLADGVIGVPFGGRAARPQEIAAASRKALVIQDAYADERLDQELIRSYSVRSLLVVPLLVRDEVVGALSLRYHSAAVGFTAAQVDFASKFATSISLALANARLYEAELQGRRLLQTLMDHAPAGAGEAAEGQETLEALMEHVPEGIAIVEAPEFIIRRVSKHGLEIVGLQRELVEGVPGASAKYCVFLRPDAVTPISQEEMPIVRAIRQGEVIKNEEWILRRPDGQLITILCNAGPIRDRTGKITGGVIAWRDITALKQMEEQLREAQKLEAVGRLAGGVAHDFNNLLTVIAGYTELLLEELAPASRKRGPLEEIRRAANRAASLTSQLLALGRRQMIQPQLLDLNGLIATLAPRLRRQLGERIKVRTLLHPALGNIKADAGQMKQIILNLAENAREAMPAGGRLVIRTGNVRITERQLLRGLELRPGPYVVLSIADTGVGMNSETRSHLFEPFFTTKEPGAGTGLGLSTVYGMVKQNGGEILVTSRPGKGTVFEIYWPQALNTAAPPDGSVPLADTAASGRTILLVEDDKELRDMVRDILCREGYTVLEASGGAEAIEVCEKHRESIKLLLTDVVMPHPDGCHLAERLAAIQPALKIIYLSGYTNDFIAPRGLFRPDITFIQKPFTAQALLGKVGKLLENDVGKPAPRRRRSRQKTSH